MNLFDGSDLSELYRLISNCNDPLSYYDLLVGNDGEVRFVMSAQGGRHSMAGCRFYFKACLNGNGAMSSGVQNQKFLNQLYKNLLYCWEHDMQGAVSQEDINRWQNYSFWLRNSRTHHGLVRIRHFVNINANVINQGLQRLPVREMQNESGVHELEGLNNN